MELGIGSNSFIVLNLAAEQAPVKAVAAFMQKDPQVLIAHPDAGIRSIADMKGHPILLADASITAFWVWLKAKYGFTDDQVRKYTFNNAPFLADKRIVQQGYLTSEPYTLEKAGPSEAGGLPAGRRGLPRLRRHGAGPRHPDRHQPGGGEGLRRGHRRGLEGLSLRRSQARPTP